MLTTIMTITDTDLVLYADGTLSKDRQKELLDAAYGNSRLKETLLALDASRLPIKAAFSMQELPAVPESLKQDVRHLISISTGVKATTSQVKNVIQLNEKTTTGYSFGSWAQAACLLLGFAVSAGAGYQWGSNVTAKHQLTAGAGTNAKSSASTDGTIQDALVNRVLSYQSLYVTNTVKGITPNPEMTEQYLNSIATTSSLKTAIPDLSEAGYQFTRAQELGFEGQPLIQLIYTKEGELPLALCFMPTQGEKNSSLRITENQTLNTADWIADGQRYVIVASEPNAVLQSLYNLSVSSFSDA